MKSLPNKNVIARIGFSLARLVPVAVFFLCRNLSSAEIFGSTNDWPQFLGPQRNGTYTGTPLGRVWPKEGPRQVWSRDVGQGFAGPSVSEGRLILFHRLENRAVVECLDPKTGKEIWQKRYSTDYLDDFGFDEGPRATPTMASGQVFTFGAEGKLSCWKLANGDPVWSVDTAKEFGAGKGFFGRVCSPLIEGQLVILTLGGSDGAGIVAFNVADGKLRWKATKDEASYASPVAASFQGKRTVLALTREALVALQPADGRVIFRYPWRPAMSASVSAATPLVVGDEIFISASYGAKAELLRFKESMPTVIWSGEDTLSNHYATSVYHDGFLYGWHGRQEQGCELRCVEFKTGKVRWKETGLKAGTVTLAEGQLLVLTERGELIRAPASPAGFKPTARVQALPSDVRATPALADGFLFARSKSKLVCLDLSEGK
ncbi:MAG: PQQ-binding-like beta-propeller repeat protein [Verrucomicrobiota bacterium]